MKITAIKITNGAGLFSKGGGYSPSFTKKGKTWTSMQAVALHLAQFKHVPNDWVIIHSEITDEGATLTKMNAAEYHQGIMERRAIREEKERIAHQRRMVEKTKRELEEATARLHRLTGGR